MVHGGAEWCTTIPPPSVMAVSERVRFTIAVDAEVYEAFADLAHSSGVSLSRCIGDWLRDTSEAAQITTLKVQQARRSPQQALDVFIREGMVPEIHRLMARSKTVAPGRVVAGSAGARPGAQVPPASNTGGKSPTRGKR